MPARRELTPPPISATYPKSVEILRAWADPDGPQQVTLITQWEDPGIWGLMLADIARHVAEACARRGVNRKLALSRIKELFDAKCRARRRGSRTSPMVREKRDRAWDVVIVDATGKPDGCSLRLRGELLLRYLRVHLEIAAAPNDPSAPSISGEHLTRAAYAVVLMTVQGEDGREETGYVGVPAACYPGESAKFAPAGTKAPPGSVETGRVGDDVAALAGRIAGSVRAR